MKEFFLKHLKVIFFALSILVTMMLGSLLGFVLVYQKGFPQIKNLEDLKPVVMTAVFDDQQTPLKEFAIEKRIIVTSTDIPDLLKKAIVASEDQQFFNHWGINFKGIMRAITGKIIRRNMGGGSSITQQLARGLFLTPEVTLSRKLREMLLAIQIEKRYTKDQILTFYLNKVFFGGSIYGVEAASRYYFGKPAKEMNLAEAALLVSILPAPNVYSIFNRPDVCLKRRNGVLQKMLLMSFITPEQYRSALTVKLPDKPHDVNRDTLADYFSEETRKYLEAKYGENLLYKGGLRVYTTLNRETQGWAEDALRNGLHAVDKRRGWRSQNKLFNVIENGFDPGKYQAESWHNQKLEADRVVEGVVIEVGKKQVQVRIGDYLGTLKPVNASWTKKNLNRILKNGDLALFRILKLDDTKKTMELGLEQEPEVEGAILVVDNKTGEIKAMVGGYAFDRSKWNRATQALRQTGSTFKPIIYTAGLENGFTAATQIDDLPFSYADEWTGELWEPRNHNEDYKGPMTFRMGLEQSRNVMTARILSSITPGVGVDYAKRFGISADLKPYMSLALGSFEVTLKEMVEAFTVFANYGVRVSAYFIKNIQDLNDNIIEENIPEKKQVVSKETAFIMNFIMQGVVRSGTGWRARSLPAMVGGKTGTTNDFTDAWFIGFTPSVTVGVWVGLDQKKSIGREETGAVAASPIFVSFMEKYLAKHPETEKFRVPAGVMLVDIDKYTGKILSPDCLYPFKEAFIPGTEPLEYCSEEEHQKISFYYRTKSEDDDDD